MKVIENKCNIFPKRIICEHCGSILEVEMEDCNVYCDEQFNLLWRTFNCPCCGGNQKLVEPKNE